MLRIELELLGIGQLPAVLQGRFNLVREPAASVTHIVFSSAVFDMLGTVYPGSSNGIFGTGPRIRLILWDPESCTGFGTIPPE